LQKRPQQRRQHQCPQVAIEKKKKKKKKKRRVVKKAKRTMKSLQLFVKKFQSPRERRAER
jgi:hypothetical protein